MKVFSLLLVSIVLYNHLNAESSWGAKFKEEDDVLVLTNDTFDEALNQFPFILVEFYAPWCGHCKKLTPEYSQAAAVLKKSDPMIPLAKIDATIEKDLATRFAVQGFPTLKWFVKGQESEYKGGRTKAEIVEWILKKTGPPAKKITTKAQLEEAKQENKVSIVLFAAEGDAKVETFSNVASQLEGVSFYLAHEELHTEFGDNLYLFKQFDELENKLEVELTADSMKAFIEENRHQLVMPFEGEEPIARIFQAEKAALVLFSDKSGDHESVFAEFAKANKGRIVFAQSKTSEGLGQRLAEYVGVKAGDAPCVRLIHPSAGDLSKYVFSNDINAENLSVFLKSFEEGTIEKTYKSAEVPATNDEPVKVVVGKNFDDIVTNSGKDVLLEFYAPWCGHCKTLAPKYDEAAKKLLYLSDKLTIAKMDATENEVQGVSVQGFPTLKFYKAGATEPMEYDGARETEGIIEWLKKNVSFEWKDEAAQETDL